MRRALALVAVVAACLLAAVPALAPAAPAGREVQRDLGFVLHSEGFTAHVIVGNNDGEVTATLIVNRGPRVAFYTTPAKVTAERVTARFGTLGKLDYRFAPKRDGSIECVGAEQGRATFDGTFDFTGENGYVQIEADHAEGTFQVDPEPKNCRDARLARRAVPYQPTYGGKGATLQATVGPPTRTLRDIIVADPGGSGPHRIGIYATLDERREGMTVSRGVQMLARSAAFRWNLERGTATVRLPAPFTGSAHFVRHREDGRGTWSGSLTMPILGGEPVELTGGAFRAFIYRGVQQAE